MPAKKNNRSCYVFSRQAGGLDGTGKTKGLLKPDKFSLIWGYAENKSSIFGVLKTKGRGGAI